MRKQKCTVGRFWLGRRYERGGGGPIDPVRAKALRAKSEAMVGETF